MKSLCKRILALVLCAATAASLALPAFAVEVSVNPIIYVADMEDIDLYEYPDTLNQKVVFDMDSAEFRSAVLKMLSGVMMSDDKGAAAAATDVINGLNAIFSPIACGATGRSKNPAVGPLQYTLPLSQYPNEPINTATVSAIADAVASRVDRDHFYVFQYDWRLDPTENAESLRRYIETVITKTRCNAVTLVSAGYGGVVTNAYLYKFRNHAAQNVFSCVFLDCPLMGNALVGDVMKGKIVKKAEDNGSMTANWSTIMGKERGDAILRYMNDDPNNIIKSLSNGLFGTSLEGQIIGVFAKYLGLDILESEGTTSKLAKSYNNFFLLAGENIYASCLREYLRAMPGLWALVPTQDYRAAMTFLYQDAIVDYECSKRIANARAVTDNTINTLKYAKADGVKTYVVAGYGRQILPVTISVSDLSDGFESTKYASAGAVTKECPADWPYQINCMQSTFHVHRSPDNDIEASTCALPENTWFIKDLKHLDFQYATAARFVAWLATSNTQRNVWEAADYPQYMVYSKYRKDISPYSNNGGAADGDHVLGDIDLDGVITPADARAVLRIAVGLDTPSKMMRTVADVDGDGEVLPADARLVLRYAVGLISNFPADGY